MNIELNCEVSNMQVCLIGQCIEGMVVSGKTSGRSFNLDKPCQSGVYM